MPGHVALNLHDSLQLLGFRGWCEFYPYLDPDVPLTLTLPRAESETDPDSAPLAANLNTPDLNTPAYPF